ncbi:MAG: AAA family ATPase, partial [Proteobacteria bacterium]|nr:AAA family ATPase [Pseudomonadota bacterium]
MSQHEPVIRKIPILRAGTTLQTVCIADVEPKPISWLWPEKIARGKLTLISGDPGLGKSLITVALASAVSNGARWPVGGGNAPFGSVILLSDEDAIADTIRPRLDAAGANCSKVHAIEMVQETTEDGETFNRSFNLASDV